MTFEEFFTKKRIDLAGLQADEPALFLEFKTHFEAMGEKSFDHTKKYWFNKLRLRFHLQPDQKPEKVHIENKIAEQTIVETLTESIPGKTKTTEEISTDEKQAPMIKGAAFKPRFKPGMQAAKHIGEGESATSTPEVNKAAEEIDQSPPFEKEKEAMQDLADRTPRITDGEPAEKAADAPMTKPAGFKPRFNAKAVPPKPGTNDQEPTVLPDEQLANSPAPTNEAPAAKPAGFKPRFNAKTMVKPSAPATGSEASEAPTVPLQDPEIPATTAAADETAATAEAPAAAKPAGFKPRFNAKMVQKPAPPIDPADSTAIPDYEESAIKATDNTPADAGTTSTDDTVAAKQAYKPRFNMKNVKPKPPEEQS